MNKFTTSLVAFCCIVAMGCSAQAQRIASITSTKSITSSNGFFPQVNYQGTQVIYSETEGRTLYLYDIESGQRTTISNDDYPGFEARFSKEGKVYYVTMKSNSDHLVFRSVHEYDPTTGQDRVVLSGQHGAVHAIQGTHGMTAVGETKQWNEANAGTFCWTLGARLYVIKNGRKRTFQPVKGCVGYLWSSISPDGKKVVMEAAGKGLYVVDAESGRVLWHTSTQYIMPCWYDNDYQIVQTHGYKILLMKADGSEQMTLASDSVMMPAVSGKYITYTTKGGSVTVMTIALRGEEGYDDGSRPVVVETTEPEIITEEQ